MTTASWETWLRNAKEHVEYAERALAARAKYLDPNKKYKIIFEEQES